ncbi:MAG: chromosomal replication initiation protein, partial [Parcubacteria group bacterium Athens0416_74]
MDQTQNTPDSGRYIKTRVESTKLDKKVVNKLLANNIRTLGGIIGRTKEELQRLLKLPGSDIDAVMEAAKTPQVEHVPKLVVDDDSIYIPKPRRPTITMPDIEGESDIIGTLSRYLGQEKQIVISHTRKKQVVRVRDLIIYMLREYGDMSYPSIGRMLNRDHTTIIHAYNKIKSEILINPELEKEFATMIGTVREIKERKLLIAAELAAQLKLRREI